MIHAETSLVAPKRASDMARVIKRRTAEDHRRAELAVEAFAPFASLEHYGRYLERLYGFYAALEARLEAHRSLDGRRKLPLLERDLEALGRATALARLPRCMALPRITSRGAALGVAYVIEGKTLGSRFLLLEAAKHLPGVEATAFLAGYGPSTGPMWTSFRAELESFVGSQGCRRAVLAAAHETFRSFTRWVGAA